MHKFLIARLTVIYERKTSRDMALDRASVVVAFMDMGLCLNISVFILVPIGKILFMVLGEMEDWIELSSLILTLVGLLGCGFRSFYLPYYYKSRIDDLIISYRGNKFFASVEIWMVILFTIFIFVFPVLVPKWLNVNVYN